MASVWILTHFPKILRTTLYAFDSYNIRKSKPRCLLFKAIWLIGSTPKILIFKEEAQYNYLTKSAFITQIRSTNTSGSVNQNWEDDSL